MNQEQLYLEALAHTFAFGVHLTCFIHMKWNIKYDLSERGFDAATQKKILDSIFGHQTGAVRMEGLVDCGSSIEFYDKLEACKPMWELLEKENSNCQGGFYDWFVKYKSKVVEDSMLRSVRHAGSRSW